MAISLVIVATSAVDNLPKTETDKVASKVVEALEDHPFKADGVAPEQQPAVAGSQDHPKVRIVPRKGVLDVNVTSASTSSTTSTTTSTPIAASVPKATEAQHNNITTTLATPQVSVGNNATVVGPAVANATLSGSSAAPAKTNVTALGNATTPGVAVPSASKPTTVTFSTTSTTTTTTTTTTSTTKPPKKPKITYSVDDEPKLVQAAKPGYSSAAGSTVSDVNGRLHVEEPLAELSKEYIAPAATLLGDPNRNPGHREYVIPVVTLIFAIPLLAGLFLLSYRRAKEFWLTRHYRRMDFLVDGMYNY